MTQHELSKAKNQDLISSVEAMKRAAALARQVAVQTGTAIVVSKDEKIIRRTAAELARMGCTAHGKAFEENENE